MSEFFIERLIRLNEGLQITGLSKSGWYVKIEAGEIPEPIREGRRSLWMLSDIVAYVRHRAETAPRGRVRLIAEARTDQPADRRGAQPEAIFFSRSVEK